MQRPMPVFGRLFSWIELRLAEELPVARMAAEAGMSVRTFYRRFREVAGRSPTVYVLERRLQRAADLLRHEPELGVAEVAARCGFADPNYFSRQFRARMGCAPRDAANGGLLFSGWVKRNRHPARLKGCRREK